MSGEELVAASKGETLAKIAEGTSDLDTLARMGMWMALASTGSKDPKVVGAANALKIAYVRSMGMPDHAASQIHLINGQFATSAQIKRAQAFTHGYDVLPTEETPDSCTVTITERRTGKVVGKPFTFTLADAKREGLLDKPGKAWSNTPGEMLFARASSRAITRYIPHVALGMMLEDEAADYDNPDVVVGHEVLSGEVMDEVPFEDSD